MAQYIVHHLTPGGDPIARVEITNLRDAKALAQWYLDEKFDSIVCIFKVEGHTHPLIAQWRRENNRSLREV